MINIIVLSQALAEFIWAFEEHCMVISIVSPEEKHPELKADHLFQYHIADIDKELLVHNTLWRPLDIDLAKRIVENAMQHTDKKKWVIHCAAGVSRSPGVALGLSKFVLFDRTPTQLENMFPCYNRHVRRIIEEAGEQLGVKHV